VIGNRRAWSGSFVSSGTQLLSLVPAHGLWIDGRMLKREPVAGARLATWPLKVWFGSTSATMVTATGNFTKIVQRVPVRIALEGDGAKLDVLRPGLSVIMLAKAKIFFAVGIDRPCGADSA
jgi:membrane fusion protein (multidrug efflux system)